MELTEQEKQILVNLLNQIFVAVKDAPVVLEIIRKLTPPVVGEKAEDKK